MANILVEISHSLVLLCRPVQGIINFCFVSLGKYGQWVKTLLSTELSSSCKMSSGYAVKQRLGFGNLCRNELSK